MSNSPFDFNLPFAPFAPFVQPASPMQRWLDMLSGRPPGLAENMDAAAGWPLAFYRSLFAGLPDPFGIAVHAAEAPASPANWAEACSRASTAMTEALSKAARQQAELCQSCLQAQPGADADAHARLEWLRRQTAQNLAQYRGIVDEYLDAWFAAAGTVADAWPAAQQAAAPAARPAPAPSTAAGKRR